MNYKIILSLLCFSIIISCRKNTEKQVNPVKINSENLKYTDDKPVQSISSEVLKQKNPLGIYENNDQYFIKSFDVNKDGIKDKIVSHNRYQGDKLFIFLGDKINNYRLALKSVNFSEDGGNQISDIAETDVGFKIITLFPDRGYLQKTYFISGLNNNFILEKIESEAESWQDGYSEYCSQNLNFHLNKSTEELFRTIGNTPENCDKIYKDRSNAQIKQINK